MAPHHSPSSASSGLLAGDEPAVHVTCRERTRVIWPQHHFVSGRVRYQRARELLPRDSLNGSTSPTGSCAAAFSCPDVSTYARRTSVESRATLRVTRSFARRVQDGHARAAAEASTLVISFIYPLEARLTVREHWRFGRGRRRSAFDRPTRFLDPKGADVPVAVRATPLAFS